MEVTPELLEKYGKGLCSESETRLVEQWLNKNEGLSDISMKAYLENPQNLENRIWKRIQLTKTTTPRDVKRNPLRKSSWRIAAVLVVLLALGIFFTLNNPGSVYQTGPGEMQTITLDDGTNIMLNAVSTLEISRDFGESNRKVTLIGFTIQGNLTVRFTKVP